jgi:formiminoglutamase
MGYQQCIYDALEFTNDAHRGIELDLDCIERVLSSAATPCGISTVQARQYVHLCGQAGKVAYLHLTEGATHLRSGKDDGYTAKLIAYLVMDFIKASKGIGGE